MSTGSAPWISVFSVKAVIVESFERIHRSNLVGMGVLPLQFMPGETRKTLELKGDGTFDILDVDGELEPAQQLRAVRWCCYRCGVDSREPRPATLLVLAS